jgi:Holliday junction resolvase RusA-like endonuclease
MIFGLDGKPLAQQVPAKEEYTPEEDSINDRLIFRVDMKPVSWNRPGGKTARYDTQIHDKGIFTELAIQSINEEYGCSILDDLPHPIMGDGPLAVTLVFCFKEEATNNKLFPVPDIDNLSKFTLDSLQSQGLKGIIWADDKQVVNLAAQKKWAPGDRIIVMIAKLKTTGAMK